MAVKRFAGSPTFNRHDKRIDCSMDISIIDHVGLNVTDLERSAHWYQKVLGFEIFHKWPTTWMVGKGAIRIGLFLRAEATPVEDIDKKIVLNHLCFLTDLAGLEDMQARISGTWRTIRSARMYGRCLFLFLQRSRRTLS